jgi:hypothetical protein
MSGCSEQLHGQTWVKNLQRAVKNSRNSLVWSTLCLALLPKADRCGREEQRSFGFLSIAKKDFIRHLSIDESAMHFLQWAAIFEL